MKPIQVAAILSAETLIINHGKREGMEPRTLLGIEDKGEWLALLETRRIYPKLSFVSPVWVGEYCPVVGVGQRLIVVDLERDLEVT